jgi:hypothetical protein
MAALSVQAMPNLLTAANHRQRAVIATLVRIVLAKPDADTARTQPRAIVDAHSLRHDS